ncbi:Ribosomal RNA large subunit methyltransferase K/L [Pseudobythopirellula maris]|uniref:Ribosomal RNA large subunit methyltransferase K/L n=1 Tax=Pseudobythopirellula maris TaxID=2527991 RepID=A0A5C5ZU70_9BACT|nr:bifunctional 23S rRNA (guanine(2069)-N(7))-methyltransferase RlmK/23S rRNA (guanine(2445)-N(2))-methyltransferase RlmL [Pseudobythopirellula maris]TWT90431.1 Ribosomal RNA large subunit methyltransferase K/L [Pseudobythopirellula maris]
MQPYELIATVAFGLEAVVVRELAALGYEAKPIQPGRVLFHGDAAAIAEANLWLRTAERVLVRLAAFEATDFGQLFDGVRELPWEEWVPADGAFPVKGRSVKSQLSSVPACQKIVKKAAVEAMREAHGVEELPETGAEHQIEIALLKNQATVTLDTTGAGLHKRGYRPGYGVAPLRETLAAGVVQLSFWRPGRPFWDPFCGAGTVAIEAAMLGRQIAPGLNRPFAAEAWPAVGEAPFRAAREAAERRRLPPLTERILATDADEGALKLARQNAVAAGVEEDIHFQQRDFSDLSSKRDYGVLVTNPPYGERLGEREEIERLYRTIPDVLRRLKTWSHSVLTARLDFEELVGQKADRRRKLYNGRIECTLFQYHGPKPPKKRVEADEAPAAELGQPPASEPSANDAQAIGAVETTDLPAKAPAKKPFAPQPKEQAFGGLRDDAGRQAEDFANRLRKLARHLRKWPTKRGITCYRLYDRDVPEIPLAVDRYEDALHIAEYERPHDRTPAEHADWLDHMVRTAADALETPRELVYLKRRARQRGDDQYTKFAERGVVKLVGEAGLRFRVNLSDYLDTGLFLDHRVTRGMVRDAADGKRFLNLFGYTGSFTTYAAAGGATETTTVDLSQNYLDWGQENLRLNKLTGPQHKFVREDGRAFVESLPEEPLYDLAVVDPPTFSNSKRLDDDWDVQQHAAPLLSSLARRMAPGGVIYFSTNFRRFKLYEDALGGLSAHEISRQTVPEDFRNKRIHRCWVLRKQDSQ